MKSSMPRRWVLAAMSGLAMQVALAQDYPSRPITIIVPYGPGGVTDVIARTVGSEVSASIGQPVVVVNRPGAGTAIGIRECARAAPDGYTLCISAPDSLSYNPHLATHLGYDADKDFTPVTNLTWTSNLLVAKANAPFNSYKEMIAYAKANPGKLNWGTWGAGTLPDVYLRWTRHKTGVDITAVPYKGLAPNLHALYSGDIDITYLGVGTALPQIKAGKIKPLAVVGESRHPLLPEVPHLAEESGDPNLRSFFGVYAPANLPAPILERLNAEFAKAIKSPKLEEFRNKYTLQAVGNSAAEFAAFSKADRDNAGKVFKIMGLQPKNID